MSNAILPSYSQLNLAVNPPEYSPRARPGTIIALSADNDSSAPWDNASAPADLYVYSTKHVTLNLGPRLWGTPLPVYGRGSAIEGFIDVIDAKGPQRVTLTFEGYSFASVEESGPHGLSVTLPRLKIVSESTTLFSSASTSPFSSTSSSAGMRIPFTVPVKLSQAYPPTSKFTKDGLTAEVAYRIRVELKRKGWSKREELIVPIAYLPRTSPPRFTHRPLPLPESVDWKRRNKSDSLEYKSFPVHKKTQSPNSPLETLPELDVQLHLPQPLVYAAQEVIHFRIVASTPSLALSSPFSSVRPTGGLSQRLRVDEEQLTENMSVELLKVVTLTVPSGRKVRREVLLACGEVCRVVGSEGGTSTKICGSVSGGISGGEATWAVIHGPQVTYEIRATLVIPAPSPAFGDEVYSCSVPIDLKTDFTEDLLGNEFAAQEPALGFLN